MENEEGIRKPGLSSAYYLVLALFVAALIDITLRNGGFLVSQGYRSHRLLFTGGILFVCLILWWAVFRAARKNEVPHSDVAVQNVRGYNWAFQPVTALVLLLIAAAIADNHSLPKLLNEFESESRGSARFVLVADPGPERRGCHPAQASSDNYGNVRLCLPPDIASALRSGDAVFVEGPRSRFGIQPVDYALTGEVRPIPQPVRDPRLPTFDDLLESMEIEADAEPPVVVPPPEVTQPTPTVAASGKNKNAPTR